MDFPRVSLDNVPMESGLNFNNTLALLVAMAILAAMPSVSVLAVSAKAASSGFKHGALVAAGIVLGDIVFLLLAVFGLALLVEKLGAGFVFVSYLGGLYLFWLGVRILRSGQLGIEYDNSHSGSLWGSFFTGVLITLGDQKAVLFYLGFLPAFLNLSALRTQDIAVFLSVTVAAVGGIKLAYAYAADKAGRIWGARFGEIMNRLAATVLFASGLWVIARSWA